MKILIADDSAVIRVMLEQNLSTEQDFELLPSVSNGRKAVDKARQYMPNLVILDDNMPEMDGIEAAKIIHNELGIPVLMFGENESSASSCSFVLFVKKPNLSSMSSAFFEDFDNKVRKAASKVSFNTVSATTKKTPAASSNISCDGDYAILLVGASTGGPTAVQQVLSGLGNNFPLPILYTQHLDVGDDVSMIKWFQSTCPNLKFSLAKNGDEAKPGHVYMAPANIHMVVDFVNSRGHCILHLSDDPPIRFLKPAVDKTFLSACAFYKEKTLAILLTGMGADGADGCKEIVNCGGCTIVEDESTCAVFGMPKAAIEAGGATYIIRREKIAAKVLSLIK